MSRRRRPTPDQVEARRWADALAARKRDAAADLDAEVAEQTRRRNRRAAVADFHARYGTTDAELRTIRRGQRQPRTWDEINSTNGGGRDFRRPT